MTVVGLLVAGSVAVGSRIVHTGSLILFRALQASAAVPIVPAGSTILVTAQVHSGSARWWRGSGRQCCSSRPRSRPRRTDPRPWLGAGLLLRRRADGALALHDETSSLLRAPGLSPCERLRSTARSSCCRRDWRSGRVRAPEPRATVASPPPAHGTRSWRGSRSSQRFMMPALRLRRAAWCLDPGPVYAEPSFAAATLLILLVGAALFGFAGPDLAYLQIDRGDRCSATGLRRAAGLGGAGHADQRPADGDRSAAAGDDRRAADHDSGNDRADQTSPPTRPYTVILGTSLGFEGPGSGCP